MLKTILLPLDGSTVSERALPYAESLARRSGSRVVLVEAVEVHPFLGVDLSEAQIAVVDEAEANLQKAATRLSAEDVKFEPHTYYDKPVPAILDAASRHHADLIVMSTHGRSGVGRMLYGSVTDQVLRRATMPVLVVPSIVDRPWSTDRPLSVLVPLDGSGLSEEALDAVAMLAAAGDTQVTLLRVVEPPIYPVYGDAYIPFDEEADVAAAKSYVEYHVAQLRARGYETYGKIVIGNPAAAIATIARDQHIDLVAMTTHGRGGLSRFLLGSTATSVLGQTTVPLLLARPAALQRTEATPELSDASGTSTSAASSIPAADEESTRTIEAHLSELDLELIEHGLKALAYAPGHDYGQVLAAQDLSRRLAASAKSEVGEPIAAQ